MFVLDVGCSIFEHQPFDTIILADVLEYLIDPWKAMATKFIWILWPSEKDIRLFGYEF
jgi:hypothetical protein